MGRPKRAPTATIDYTNVNNAKDLFDLIGKYIQQKVHGEALEHSKSKLHGLLSQVEFSKNEKTYVIKACDINKDYETNVTSGHSNPCEDRSKDRFSDTEGAQCDYRKIRGSHKTSNDGACAPLRRLHLCDQNLEQIEPHQIKNTHNLYVDVLLAAKHEGQMLVNKLQEYDKDNYESRICTALARSFADIGDIIRGKDLYRGNKKKNQTETERDKLEGKLQSFFKNIHDNLHDSIKSNYNNDTTNYFQLREDWWDANRLDVWKAITCDAPEDAKYFRDACSEGTTSTHKQCRCATNYVPTYFDYVPQYLRWFEEWAEDFCRIKRRKLQNLEKECRGQFDDKPRYCSRNGYDCEKTVRARGELCMGNRCIDCLYACPRYEKWLANQKQEFLKQKEKYAKEISNSVRKKRSTNNNIYKGYDTQFYDELQNEYGRVNKFLILLNNETECKGITNKEGKIDFKEDHDKDNNTVKEKGTFYRSDYCEPCPLCGVQCSGTTCTPHPEDGNCPSIYKIYKPDPNDPSTDITILSSGDGNDDIKKKLDDFCKKSNNNSLYEKWKCYYKDAQKEACILQTSSDTDVKKQKSYNDFFYYWVAHMLKDSIYWETQKLEKCLKNKSKKCGNQQCKDDCECFQRWVGQKKTEWTNIKEHFGKQTDIPPGFPPDALLEQVLELEFSNQNTVEDKKNNVSAREIDLINKMLKEDKTTAADGTDSQKKNTIDKLLQHELTDAQKCKKTQEECENQKKQKEQPKDMSRALDPPADRRPASPTVEE
ncbi:hypothetical protein PFMC_06051, partial [Plasmodium falciparum CAMP/Malaysia]